MNFYNIKNVVFIKLYKNKYEYYLYFLINIIF